MTALIKRLIGSIFAGIITLLVVATFTFFLLHLMPGDPVQARLTQLEMNGMSVVQAEDQVKVMYGFMPNGPIGLQYLQYMWGLLHLNFGQSLSYEGTPVLKIMLGAMPWTLIPVLSGTIISFIIGILMGVWAAVKRNSAAGNSLTVVSTVIHTINPVVVALALAYILTVVWKVFPFGAPVDASLTPGFNWPYLGSLAWHAILPVSTYVIVGYGGWMLGMKSSVTSVLGDDFILASEVRGIKSSIRMRYTAHNAILPLFQGLALAIGGLFGGSVLIENVFDYPGLGNMLNQAMGYKDIPLMMGAFLLICAATLAANIAADFLFAVIDPRIRVRR